MLAGTKEKVLATQAKLRGKGLQNLERDLRTASGYAFYNASRYDFEKLLADAPHLAANPPQPLEEIEADIRAIESDILRMLAAVTGSEDRRGDDE